MTSENSHEEENLFYFESDHLALRGNKDYSDALKHLLLLCAQRKKSIENYNIVVEMKKEALKDPSKVLQKIRNHESLGVPDLFQIAELPVFNLNKYKNVQISEDTLNQIYAVDDSKKKVKESPEQVYEKRERWSTEEQKRLEELLQVYPPEPIEMRRYKKIANALGNRTIQQVTSRLQKYFLKLYKAGLPVPGRIPKRADKYKRGAAHKHQRHNHYLSKPTTFFPALCVPVVMSDLDETPGPTLLAPKTENDHQSSSSNYLFSSNYYEDDTLSQKSESEMQIDLLKRVRRVKLKEKDHSSTHHHLGYKCDFCDEEPIVGTRWHCITCKTDSVDFCTDCVVAQLYSDNSHKLNHSLVTYGNVDASNESSDSDSEPEEMDMDESSGDEDGSFVSSNANMAEETENKEGESEDEMEAIEEEGDSFIDDSYPSVSELLHDIN